MDDFQGDPKSKNPSKPFDPEKLPPMDTVTAPDVPLVILKRRIEDAKSETHRQWFIEKLEYLIDVNY